jgi:hypothetical protein
METGPPCCVPDTDSLLMHIETEDIYADIAAEPNEYDTSDYPDDHPLTRTPCQQGPWI